MNYCFIVIQFHTYIISYLTKCQWCYFRDILAVKVTIRFKLPSCVGLGSSGNIANSSKWNNQSYRSFIELELVSSEKNFINFNLVHFFKRKCDNNPLCSGAYCVCITAALLQTAGLIPAPSIPVSVWFLCFRCLLFFVFKNKFLNSSHQLSVPSVVR